MTDSQKERITTSQFFVEFLINGKPVAKVPAIVYLDYCAAIDAALDAVEGEEAELTMRYTPGPWIVDQDDPTAITAGILLSQNTLEGVVPQEEAEANARLISAAPEMGGWAVWRGIYNAIAMAEGRAGQ